MEVVITEWALQSYLELKNDRAFTEEEYKTVIRPDVELLADGFPSPHAKLGNNKFWCPAESKSGEVLRSAFKMKWHNVGDGKNQLRLLVAIIDDAALLCEAYVKKNDSDDHRHAAKMKIHLSNIAEGTYVTRGKL